MAHNHAHNHGAGESGKNIGIAFFLNFIFAIVELIGGFLTNSIAILSDALHDFGDSVSLAVAWYLQRISTRGRDKFYSYGYKRFSLLGAIFISVVLIIGSVFIIKECAERLASPQETNAQGMFFLAIAGIVVNGAAALRLKRGKSLNEKAVFLHIMEDVLGWAAVLVASIVMIFVEGASILDPLLSIGICIWVLSNVYKNLKSTLKILLQEVPQDVDVKKLESDILSIENVDSIHDVHLWTLDGETHVMTLHVVTATPTCSEQQSLMKQHIRDICEGFHIDHTTIEFESREEECEEKAED